MKTIIAGTSNYINLPKKLDLYAVRYDSFSYKFNYKISNEGEIVNANLDLDTLVQSQIKNGNKYNSKKIKTIPVIVDINKDEIELFFNAGELDLVEGKYFYDVEIFYNNKRKTILSGKFIVLPQVTDWIDQKKQYGEFWINSEIKHNVIKGNQQLSSNISNSILYDYYPAFKIQLHIGNLINSEVINNYQYNADNIILTNIDYKLTPVIMNNIVMLSSEIGRIVNMQNNIESTIFSSINYEII